MTKTKEPPAGTLVPMTELLPFWSNVRGFGDFARLFEGSDMKVEEFQEDGTFVVRAELPDVDPDKDIDITIQDGKLRIEAHRMQRSEHKDDKRYRSELRYGSFRRVLPLPPDAVADDVKATYRDGMLEVRLPVDAKRAAAERIPIARS